jgi:hypothetical protein
MIDCSVTELQNKTANRNKQELEDMTSSRSGSCHDNVIVLSSDDESESDYESGSKLPQWEDCRSVDQSSPASNRLVVGNHVNDSSNVDPEILEFYGSSSEKSLMVMQKLLEAAGRLFGENNQQQQQQEVSGSLCVAEFTVLIIMIY